MMPMKISRGAVFISLIFAPSVSLSVSPASAAPTTIEFQAQPYVVFFSSDIPAPLMAATVGAEPGVAVLHVIKRLGYGPPVLAANVHWISLGTGASGIASFRQGNPPPVVIHPGSGQVVAYVAPLASGLPGVATFYVP